MADKIMVSLSPLLLLLPLLLITRTITICIAWTLTACLHDSESFPWCFSSNLQDLNKGKSALLSAFFSLKLSDASIYLSLLRFAYYTWQRLYFLQIEDLGQCCIEEIYRWCFSNSIVSLHVSVSHCGNSLTISKFFRYYYICYGVCDQWSLVLLLWFSEGSDDCRHFLALRYFLIKVCTLFF